MNKSKGFDELLMDIIAFGDDCEKIEAIGLQNQLIINRLNQIEETQKILLQILKKL